VNIDLAAATTLRDSLKDNTASAKLLPARLEAIRAAAPMLREIATNGSRSAKVWAQKALDQMNHKMPSFQALAVENAYKALDMTVEILRPL
jgi:hypothetical protein